MQNLADELRSTVEDACVRFAAIPEEAAATGRHPGAWSSKEVLGHLIDSASNNHQRFVRMQMADYLEMPNYEQESWVRSQGYAQESWTNLVELWRRYNLHLAHVLSRVPQAALQNRCKIGDHEPMTLERIATDYLSHMRHHLEQITA